MNKDDIARMAQEAGWQKDMFGFGIWDSKELNVFAALVAAAEREACAKVAEEPYEFTSDEAHRIAESIRARGNR